MTTFADLWTQPYARAFGWALIHFAWQGAVVAALTAILLARLSKVAAQTRYRIACAALAVMAVMPPATVLLAVKKPNPDPLSRLARVAPAAFVGAYVRPVSEAGRTAVAPRPWGIAGNLEPAVPYVAGAWLLGVALLGLRFAGGWWVVSGRLRAGGRPADDRVLAAFREAVALLPPHNTAIVRRSPAVDSPLTIGLRRPLILVPETGLEPLTPAQLRGVLAHEVAHVIRKDYLAGMTQSLVEILWFFHPGVWWLSRRISEEREHCCDDMAVITSDARGYARGLAELEAQRGGAPHWQLAAGGSPFMERIRRLSQPGAQARLAAVHQIILAAGLLVTCVTLVYTGATSVARAQTPGKKNFQAKTPALVEVREGVPAGAADAAQVKRNAEAEAHRNIEEFDRASPERKLAILNQLASAPGPEARAKLESVAGSGTNRQLRSAALDYVAGAGGLQAAQALLRLYNLPEPWFRALVLNYLAANPSPAAAEKIVWAAQYEPDLGIRREALNYIAGRGAAGAAQLLRIYGTPQPEEIQSRILDFFLGLGTPETLRKLRAVAESDPNPNLRGVAQSHLERLARRERLNQSNR